tara:strand:- start:1311 stop:2552 length:1242 start_codon:yes stop_codon:yes gene_type:complete
MIIDKIYNISNKKYYLFRLLSSILRFIPQIIIIKLISPEVFAEYSLFITFTFLIISTSSINLSTGFIAKFNKDLKDEKNINLLLIKLLLGINIVTVPVFLVLGIFYKINFLTNHFFPILFYLLTESIIIEYQRFKYSLGDDVWLTRIELLNALSICLSIIFSCIIYSFPISNIGFIFLIIKNILIIKKETNIKFNRNFSIKFISKRNIKNLFENYIYLIKTGAKEIIQLQFFIFIYFIEKLLIKKYMGLIPLSIFSLSQSFFQNICAVLLLPNFAKLRRLIFLGNKFNIQSYYYKLIFKSSILSFIILPFNSIIILGYLIIDEKYILLDSILIILLGIFSANFSSVSTILSPRFSLDKEKTKKIFLYSIFITSPLITLSIFKNNEYSYPDFILCFSLIIINSFLQLNFRILNI